MSSPVAATHGVSRLVYTSSPSVVFAGVDQCGVDESAPYDFAWMKANGAHYSRSKALAEQAVLAASDATLRTCALRPHLIWGPRDNHLIPRLIDRARSRPAPPRRRRRESCRHRSMSRTRPPLTCRPPTRLTADELAGRPGKAYFLSQGEPVNCWEWIDEILALAELPPVAKSISYASARRARRLCETILPAASASRPSRR